MMMMMNYTTRGLPLKSSDKLTVACSWRRRRHFPSKVMLLSQRNIFLVFTSALPALCVQCQKWLIFCSSLISWFPYMLLSQVLSGLSWDCSPCPYYYWNHLCFYIPHALYFYYYYYHHHHHHHHHRRRRRRRLLSQAFSSRYFSWNSGDPHRSGFKFHTAVLSVLCVIFQVQPSFVVSLLNVFLI